MIKAIPITILITAVFTITACAPGRNQPDSTTSDLVLMQQRLTDSEERVAQLSQQVARLQATVDENQPNLQKPDQSPDAAAPRNDEAPLPAVPVIEAVPGTDSPPKSDREVQEASAPHEPPRDSHQATLKASAADATPLNDATHPRYRQAMDAFRKGDYQSAVPLFEAFVDDFPESDLADNALYWTGECKYSNKEFSEAIQKFQQVVEEYPSGSKVPDALLKIGFSFISLGDRESAVAYLKKVVAQYPFSSAGDKAEERLKTLR